MAGGGVEDEFGRIFGGGLTDQALAAYVFTRRQFELAQTHLRNPSRRDFDFFYLQWASDNARSGLARCREIGGDDLALAVVVSAVVGSRSWLYRSNQSGASGDDIVREIIGYGGGLGPLYRRAVDLADEIRPRNQVGGMTISLECMETARRGLVENRAGGGEIVSVIGLNGSGKTTAVAAIRDFVEFIGLKGVNWVKFPRLAGDGPISELVQSVLRGDVKLHGGALQMLMLAEMVDYLGAWGGGGLCITDRLAALDGQVYDVEEQRHISLAMLEIIGRRVPVSLIILDRHPLACYWRRMGDSRLTVGAEAQFVARTLEMYRMAALPGAIVVNNDISADNGDGVEGQVFAAQRRVLAALVETGALQRQLVGKMERLNTLAGANLWVNQRFFDWVIARMPESG